MNDQIPPIEGAPGEEPRSTEPRPPEPGEPRRLTRSSGDRVLAGVAGGLGRYFGVDPVMFRIGFVISLFFGGLGAIGYGLLWLFVPIDADPDLAQRAGGRLRALGFWRGLGLLALGVLLLAGLAVLAAAAAFGVGLGWGVPTAILIIAIGALLALAAFRGGARWLIAPALALAVGATVAAASDLDLRGGIGDRQYRPLSFRSIPATGYRLGVGRLDVDLRRLDWGKGRVVPLRVSLGMGQANVYVPSRVCVAGSAHAGVGETALAGERNDGVDVSQTAGAGPKAAPRVRIDADVDVGQVRVINSDTASIDHSGYGPGRFGGGGAAQRAAEARSCATG
jgi:phage shock protein PspC (stress-responsive transcriptional regulator)